MRVKVEEAFHNDINILKKIERVYQICSNNKDSKKLGHTIRLCLLHLLEMEICESMAYCL